MRIEADAGGYDPSTNVGAVVDMDGPIGAEFPGMAFAVEIEVGYAFRGEGIAEDGVQQPHIQVARCFGLPTGMGKVLEGTGYLQGLVACCAALRSPPFGCDSQRTQISSRAGQVDRGLHKGVRGLRFGARQVQIGGACLDAIDFWTGCGRGNVLELE